MDTHNPNTPLIPPGIGEARPQLPPARHDGQPREDRDARNNPDAHHDRGEKGDGPKGHNDHPRPKDEHGEEIPKDLPKVGLVTILVVSGIFVGLLLVLFLIGFIPHRRQVARAKSEAAAARNALPVVSVAKPKKPELTKDFVLPGDARALQTTSIFPRANGYLKELNVDIGDPVKAGQTLAVIDTPEIDAQLLQAESQVKQATANVTKAEQDYQFARDTTRRYEGIAKTGGVTQQQLDQTRSAEAQAKSILEAARASVGIAQADVQRLTALKGYEKVDAPFAGIITARNYDLGALMNPANFGPGKELFTLDRTDKLRIFVNVPQAYATLVRVGQTADYLVRNYAGTAFPGAVTRTTGALDPATRTLRVQVDVDNPKGLLFPGMYGQIKFAITQQTPPVTIPTSALVFNAEGLHIATVGEDNKVHFKPVTIGRDFGTEVEVTEGLDGDERVVTNPGEKLAEGKEVKVIEASKSGQGQSRVAAAK